MLGSGVGSADAATGRCSLPLSGEVARQVPASASNGANRAARAAASRLRLMAAAVGNAWMRMFRGPRRTALASPCQVFASPWNPSGRQGWR